MPFIISSNIFLLIPVVIAFWKGEWIYFSLALSLVFFSPLYHYLRIYRSESRFHQLVRELDWLVALLSYLYMFYIVSAKVPEHVESMLYILLIFTILFFIYGYKLADYRKYHPWFHIVAPIVSGIIIYYVK